MASKGFPEAIKLRRLVREAYRLNGSSAGAGTIADIITNDESHDITLTRYRAGRFMKAMNLVSCQLPKYAYRKAIQRLSRAAGDDISDAAR